MPISVLLQGLYVVKQAAVMKPSSQQLSKADFIIFIIQIRKQKFTEVFHQHIEELHHKLTSVWPEASTD